MTEDHKAQLPIVLSFLDDARRLIEGGKGRRWEVFKWTVALNILLTTSALTQSRLPIATVGLFLLALGVSFSGGFLIAHYDRRMTKARDRARNLAEWLRTNASIDMYAVMGETKLIPSRAKDAHERTFFFVAIAASLFAVAIALSLK